MISARLLILNILSIYLLPGESLFTSEFYAGCKAALNENGIFVAQNGVCFLQQEEAVN
ncbi:hypothetical protein HZD82_25375, partial [Pantoea agglomerans]|nr:hypothetical protein [Pantoea agglomerans]